MAVSNAPTLADVKAWLGLDPADTTDDVVLQESLDAALAAQAAVVLYPLTADEPPVEVMTEDLRSAVYLRTQRLAARRNSPEGVVGLTGTGGDFAAARLPSGDSDVIRLEGPYLKIPVA